MANKKVTPPSLSLDTILTWKDRIKEIFYLKEDTDYGGTIDNLRKGVEIRGQGVYTLIFAIFIASVGLNINSTAVIIGAMLISPLMGPIMGAGLALGTYDFLLLKRAGMNLFVMTSISLLASTLYFWLSPLGDAQSELLARTSPTIYDVLIATFGGATGIFAASRRDKASNAIPGVAIATALMPPLCTAGFGLATGNFRFFVGALYLYLINSIFIGLSTFIFIRAVGFRAVGKIRATVDKRIRRYVLSIAILVAIPSIYMAYDIVKESKFAENVRKYVAQNFNFEKSRVLNTTVRHKNGRKVLEISIVGSPISDEMITHLRAQLTGFSLEDTELVIIQPEKFGLPAPSTEMNNMISETKDKNDRIHALENEIRRLRSPTRQIGLIAKEVNVVFPQIESISFGDLMNENIRFMTSDTAPTLLVKWKKNTSTTEKKKFAVFIKLRLNIENIQLIEL
ncbi:MAG TPA: DUF389 domain-containing protein [Turneriella sp.]|nr:DUF389 domain-containing protein [Turneriella sp.]